MDANQMIFDEFYLFGRRLYRGVDTCRFCIMRGQFNCFRCADDGWWVMWR